MRSKALAKDTTSKDDISIAIIGSGFGGLGLAIQLKKAGINNFTIFEKASDVGGVWRDNTYPGAACDVPSHLYSFSFEQELGWNNRFGTADEIHGYLRHCADKYGIRQAGFWTTLIGESNQDLTYMLAWESMAEREKKFGAFGTDPEWLEKRAETEASGQIVASLSSQFLQPTSFSSVK